MKIKDLMSSEVEVIGPEATLKEAAEKMCAIDAGTIPVVSEKTVVGILTDRDITVRGVAEGRDPAKARVREIMTRDVVYCYDDQEVEDAAELMAENQVRRLVVL